jgi:hypothetical protein
MIPRLREYHIAQHPSRFLKASSGSANDATANTTNAADRDGRADPQTTLEEFLSEARHYIEVTAFIRSDSCERR